MYMCAISSIMGANTVHLTELVTIFALVEVGAQVLDSVASISNVHWCRGIDYGHINSIDSTCEVSFSKVADTIREFLVDGILRLSSL